MALESGEGGGVSPLLDEREGVTDVVRVFRIEALSDNATTSNLPYTVMSGNSTSETGVIVFPLKVSRTYSLIQEPQPGGPYLNDLNNFTAPPHIDDWNPNYRVWIHIRHPPQDTTRKRGHPNKYNGNKRPG